VEKETLPAEVSLERGWNAFNAERYGEAIKLWERAARNNPGIIPALAEAYFRRAVSPTASPEQRLQDLQRATALVPNDACYYYHLGLVHHRRGEFETALMAYQIASESNPQQRGLAFTAALAKLEADPNADVSSSVGLDESEREIINAVAMLLRGDTSFLDSASESGSWFKSLLAKLSGADVAMALWRGLGYLLAGADDTAQKTLNSANRLTAHGEALRHYYLGVIAARRGDWSAALISWQQARTRGLNTAWLRENLAAAHLPSAIAAVQAENWKLAVEQARAALQANPGHADAVPVAAVALDRLARGAVGAGNWTQAATHWSEASKMLANAPKSDGTTRPILQNLAIASEMCEAWEQAAEAWRALLRTKPRSKKAKDTFGDTHWNWIRKRATLDLQKAGRLGEAITLMKQKVKSDPNNLAARLELVEALIANQQETAARNELQRVLQIDPQHAEARQKLAEWHAARQEWYAAEMEIKQILDQDQANETARKQMALLMAQRGRSLHAGGKIAAARDVFEHASAYAPNNADIHIDLGRTALDLQQPDVAQRDFEEAYRIGAKQISTHEQIVRCWAIARNFTEVKTAIARAEREAQPNPLFYVHAGIACLQSSMAFGSPFAPTSDKPNQWEKLGKALVEQGVALKPDDVELVRHIVMDFVEIHSRFGLPYAERLAKLTPDDPAAWITLGMFQLLNQQLHEARASLQQAARFARHQGQREIEQMANQMRRELDNPMLSMAVNLGLPLDLLFGQFPDEEEFEDEGDEFFWMPRRRRRRR
jgi:tetratricopeptide (TPR) repeat protein